MVKNYMEKMETVEKVVPKVKDIMVDSPVTFKKTDDIHNVIRSLLSFKITGAPVLDEMGDLTGFISEKDCLRIVALNAYHGGRRSGTVEEFMTCEEALTTVTPDTGLYKVAQIFLQLPYKKLMVSENRKLMGIVRRSDVLKAVLS